jgi:hypothetical protein
MTFCKTYVVASYIGLCYPSKLVAATGSLDDFLQDEIHPRIAADKNAIVVFAILELDEHWLANGCIEDAEGELRGVQLMPELGTLGEREYSKGPTIVEREF